jgi:CheY-like chemotaxis protein
MIREVRGQDLETERGDLKRVLVVDDDALARAVLLDVLGGLGVEAVGAAGGMEGLLLLRAAPFDLLISDVLMPEIDGFEVAAAAAELPNAPLVVLTSAFYRGDPEADAAAKGLSLAGLLPKPHDPERVAALLKKLEKPAPARKASAGHLNWSGLEFLSAVDGPLERFPPARVLFLAHRVDGSGALAIQEGENQVTLFLRGGRLVHALGVPALLRALDPRLTDQRDLSKDIGEAVRAGHEVQRAIEAAAEGLGEYLGNLVGASGGRVRFDAGAAAPAGAFPLPLPIPRLLGNGLRLAHTPAHVERVWSARAQATPRLRLPDDSPEARWGLDATASRVIRAAPGASNVGALVAAVAGAEPARRPDVLRAMDFLAAVGILLVDGGQLEAIPVRTTGGGSRSLTQEDPRMIRLRAALTALQGRAPVDVLELGDRRVITEAEVASAYREISRRFHPDTHTGAPPVVRALAEACFGQVNGAYEALRLPGGLVEAQRQLAARAEGRKYVPERDQQAARIAFRRGEVLFRNRDWKGADALFLEALTLDPDTWPHALYAIRTGHLSRRIPADAAVKALDELSGGTGPRKAEVLVAVGNILKVEARAADALRRFRQALEADPENRDAQREVRLHEARNQRVETPSKAPSGVLSWLNRRGGGGG